jgi:hypothetical protein
MPELTSFSYTSDTTMVGKSMLNASVKKNGPRDDPKSKLRKVPIFGICPIQMDKIIVSH